ncbi:MAG: zinc ribbon domain-containing protein, partial [Planctomycetaceae bacterium]|nr:zinc ribbon domain-containing protein [Planctomycetaceae bacterium]
MPTYDYACDACKHTWEEFQPITAKPTRKCPNCKKQKAKRLIGAGAGLLFKGSGFYITDYRSSNYKKGAEADKKSSSSSS